MHSSYRTALAPPSMTGEPTSDMVANKACGSNQDATISSANDERPFRSPPPFLQEDKGKAKKETQTENETDTPAVLKGDDKEGGEAEEEEEDGLPSIPSVPLPSYELETLEVQLTATASSLAPAFSEDDEADKDAREKESADDEEDFRDNDTSTDKTRVTSSPKTDVSKSEQTIKEDVLEADDCPPPPRWSFWDRNVCIVQNIHHPVTRALQAVTYVAASYPRMTLIALSLISVGMTTLGLLTNFYVETDNGELWPPRNSLSEEHFYWLYEESHFNYLPVQVNVLLHSHGANVASQEGITKVFEIIDTVRQLDGYQQGCAYAELVGDLYHVGQCHITSVADFWNQSYTVFHDSVQSEDQVLKTLSSPVYPSTGVLVEVDTIMGNTQYQRLLSGDTLLESAESLLIQFAIPWSNVTLQFEQTAIQALLALRETWLLDHVHDYQLEMWSFSSFSNEFERAILADLYLIPIAFALVTVYTITFCFGKCDRVQSRGLLGMGAALTILASLMTAFGLLFAIGVPFTTNTLMVPFLMFGIGMDDAYIIFGSYHRRSSIICPRDRIQSTMEDVGVSIFLTTTTSVLAFVLGAFSRIPAVQWLCMYAFPCIAIDFIYQITFFVALIVLDEKRIQENRMDYCTWIKVPRENTADNVDTHELLSTVQDDDTPKNDHDRQQQDQAGTDNHALNSNSDKSSTNTVASSINYSNGLQEVALPEMLPAQSQQLPPQQDSELNQIHRADRIMGWFAVQLLKPWAQAVSILLFATLTAVSIYWATQLRQEFDFTDLVPRDSYVKGYYNAQQLYTRRAGRKFEVYFTDVNFSDPAIQEQMQDYLDDLIMSGIVIAPGYFWLWDFQDYVEQHNGDVIPVKNTASKNRSNVTLFRDLNFDEQVHEFLSVPIYYELYDDNIGVTKEGEVMETRLTVQSTPDPRNSKAMTDMLKNLRSISEAQPINKDNEKFFCYDNEFHMYEFYHQVVVELIFDTVMGLSAVTLVALFFIPHWSAVFFVFPFISLLYVNMLGYLYISGVMINAVSYITLLMSIGLMVDYVMHLLMRFYESKGSRHERVVETLTSMGASILMGASSTFLGLLVLAFSTSTVLQDIFISCVGLVSLGIVNGLIFLPVILSLIGPEH